MPVLMIHGAGGGAWEWNVWRRVFATAGFAVATPDLEAVAAGTAATRWQDYLDQCVAAARALPAPRVLVGASLGGLLALAVASEVECAALILINPLPPLPESAFLPASASYPAFVPWGRDASLAGTRRALPGADDAARLHAFRRWRDESGAVLNAARAGLAFPPPRCPALVIASDDDDDVPPSVSARLAVRLDGSLQRVAGGHVDPLLGRAAAELAGMAVRWLNAAQGFRTD